MDRKDKKLLLAIMLIIELIMVNLTYQSFLHKEINKEKNAINKKQFAMYVNNGNGYKEYNGESLFPQGYYLNKNMSHCEDINGNEVENVISAEGNKITITSNKTVYCTLYFEALFKGSGTEEDPYQINVIEDLVKLSNEVNNGEGYAGIYFELTKDLDFNKTSDYQNYQSKDYGDINGNSIDDEIKTELTSGSGWKPIGNSWSISFQGIFNGNDYTLANIYIHNTLRQEYGTGLFGYIKNGTIKNLKITGKMTTTLMNDIGGIAGMVSGATIDTCESNVEITSDVGSYSLGGMVGTIGGESTIKNCINKGNITNGNNTGGIAGVSTGNLTIQESQNYGKITNNLGQQVGGLLGRDNNTSDITTIINSSNNGVVVSNPKDEKNTRIGGLVGLASGTIIIDKSHNSGEVRNDRTTYSTFFDISTGGLVGQIAGNDKNINKITNSYNEGHLVGGTKQGGILGYNITKAITIIDNCYNNGINESQVVAGGNQTAISGIAGYNNGNSKLYVLNSYNEGNITSIRTAQGITYTDAGATTLIINSYNAGNINGGTWTGGIFVVSASSSNGIANNVKLNNVYNLGNITGSNAYELGYRNGTTGIVEITNSYYESTKKGTNVSGVSGTPLTLTNMKSQTFVDTLNNNLSSIDLNSIDSSLKDYSLNKWKLGSDGYPVLDGEYITDLSGSGHNGISYAVSHNEEGVTTSTDSSNLGYVDLGFKNYDFGNELSLLIRVKINNGQQLQYLIGNWESGGGGITNKFFEEYINNAYYQIVFDNILETNKWYTIVATYDGNLENNNLKVYINGTLQKDMKNIKGNIKSVSSPLVLGGNPDITGYKVVSHSYSTFSDALIFDRALSEEEIKTNYSDIPNPVNKDELLLWYKF